MPDQTLDQLPDSTSAEEADNLYATRSGASIRMKLGVALSSRIPTTRTLTTTNGIKGGGDGSANRTIELDINGLTEDVSPDLANDFLLSHDSSANLPRKVRMNRINTGGGVTETSPGFAAVSSPGQSTVSATTTTETLNFVGQSNIQIQTDPATKTVRWLTTGLASNTVSISAGAGLTGGGNLTANRSLSIDIPGQSEDLNPDINADYTLVHDTSSGILRRVKLALLSSSSYSLPTATASRLGGIRIGNGFTYDDVSGILSVAPTGTSYVLPAATASVRGGIRVGTGFTLSGDLLTNANPTPYALPPAGVNTLGGIKAGPGIEIASDGTASVSTGASGTDNSFRPESYGAIRGTGLTQQQRESNTNAINTCWNQAAVVKGRVDMGGGTWEIYGQITLANVGAIRIDADWCTIRQFQSAVSIIEITNASQITMCGFMLAYQTNQTSGADPVTGETYVAALRLNSLTNCRFSDIDTVNAWVHIGLSGGTGSFSNTFTNCRLGMAAGQAWGLIHKTGNANNFINLRVTGGLTAQTVTGGTYIGGADQVTFTNLVCEGLSALRPMMFSAVRAATVTGGVINRITPRATASFGTIVTATLGSIVQMTGIHVSATTLTTSGQSMTDAVIFAGEEGASFLVASMTLTGTVKVGAPRFSLLGHTSAAAARNVSGTFQQIRLDTSAVSPHLLDDLSVATVDPASDALVGPLLCYNGVLGELTGSLHNIGDESLTVYPAVHGRHIQCNTALSAERTVTLSRYIDRSYSSGTYQAPRTVRGATIRVTRTAVSTGSALLTVANHNGTSIVTLASNQSVQLVFDGSNFVQVPGSLSTGGGGGGGTTVTFATTAEAITGTSTTTAMSPARTKEAFNSMIQANEITGSLGQVLGFDAAGNAATVKLTRTITVPLVAETVTVTAQVAARRILAPFSIKLTEIRFYVVTAGTSATTIDVNVGGVSILTAPVSVAANSTYASTTSFTALSNGTISVNGAVSFDIDVAGAGAKGVQVTLVGNEV
jgi:hypothetical protein